MFYLTSRVWFILFVWMVSLVVECAVYMAVHMLVKDGYDILIIVGLSETIFFVIISHLIFIFGVSCVALLTVQMRNKNC